MKKQKKNQKGITLIALVITIVVLIILAGVSISLIVGENGVLRKAMNAKEVTKESSAIEQVSLAWSACQSEYLTNSTDITREECFSKENLNANLSEGEITAVSIGVDEVGTSEVIYKRDDIYYKMQLIAGREWSIEGKPSTTIPTIKDPITQNEKTLASQITSANYGDYVAGYGIDLGIVTAGKAFCDGTLPRTDWRIFYKNSTNVYLIASDYLPTSKFPNNVFDENDGKYSGYYRPDDDTSVLNSSTVTSNNKFLFTKLSNIDAESRNNIPYKATITLLDSKKWSSLANAKWVDNTQTSVIGSPTAEMWIESWNQKHSDSLVCDANENGYLVNRPRG